MKSKYDWDAIKASVSIVDVIGQSVDLKRRGGIHEGCCPFHKERTPSFKVFDDNYHCFGCGAHGDVVDFVVAMDNCTPQEAIARLNAGDLKLSGQEREILKERHEQRERERKESIHKARVRWERAELATEDHPYLVRKEIKPHMARVEDGKLLIPVYDANGDIQSVQTIAADGAKLFQSGAPMDGGRVNFGICIGKTIIAEGFATAASIYEAKPDRVVVGFSKSGVIKLARELHALGQDVVIATDRNAIGEVLELSAELGIPVYAPHAPHDDFNDLAVDGGGHEAIREIFSGKPLLAKIEPKAEVVEQVLDDTDPVDIWARNDPPEPTKDIVPTIIWRAASQASELSGADVGGYIMAMLTTLGAALPDRVKVKVKRSEEWRESARHWCMLIGEPSYKKSPILNVSTRAISKIDARLVEEYEKEYNDWSEHKDGDMPVATRIRIDDITMEAAQEVARYSPDGVLALQDELSGWFGGIEKYAGGKGSAKDRSFWLRAFGGGQYAVNRVSRKPFLIENLSISIIGGIQPDAIRRIMQDATDDGLIQRFFPVVLRPAKIGKDDMPNDAIQEYDALVERMRQLTVEGTFWQPEGADLTFDAAAQALRSELEEKHHHMVASMETVNKKMSSHLGKYDGMLCRLCVLFHAIENANAEVLPATIKHETAERAARFLHEYIMKHAMAFYFNMIGVSDDQDVIEDIAGYIIAHKVEKVTMSTFHHGSTRMRKFTRREIEPICDQLEALGWLDEVKIRGERMTAKVNPRVHEIYSEKAEQEAKRRKDVQATIKGMLK